MQRAGDATGRVFGRLTAICKARHTKKGILWLCECSCGNTKEVMYSSLVGKSSSVRSCGCLKRETAILNIPPKPAAHPMSNTPIHNTWRGMLSRCRDKTCPTYKNYGGRGISVCTSWECFDTFIQDMGDRPVGMTLDRVNNDLGYCKDNCRWATWVEQANNRRERCRDNFSSRFFGVSLCRRTGKWKGSYKKKYLGTFSSEWSCHMAVEAARSGMVQCTKSVQG